MEDAPSGSFANFHLANFGQDINTNYEASNYIQMMDGCGNGSIAHAVTEPSQVERIYETVPETPQMRIINEMMQETCETSDLEEEGKQSEKGSPVQKRGRRIGSGVSLKLTVGEWCCAYETYLALPMNKLLR